MFFNQMVMANIFKISKCTCWLRYCHHILSFIIFTELRITFHFPLYENFENIHLICIYDDVSFT